MDDLLKQQLAHQLMANEWFHQYFKEMTEQYQMSMERVPSDNHIQMVQVQTTLRLLRSIQEQLLAPAKNNEES